MITKDVTSKFVEGFANVAVVNTPVGEVNVTNIITSDIAQAVTEAIADAAYSADGGYRPDIVDAVARMIILSAYTDIELPDSFDDKYMFVYASGVYESVISSINQWQLKSVMNGVDEMIRYRIRMNVNAVESNMIAVSGELTTVLRQFKEMYNGVSGDDMKSLVSAISNTKLDEAKLVEAITAAKE